MTAEGFYASQNNFTRTVPFIYTCTIKNPTLFFNSSKLKVAQWPNHEANAANTSSTNSLYLNQNNLSMATLFSTYIYPGKQTLRNQGPSTLISEAGALQRVPLAKIQLEDN